MNAGVTAITETEGYPEKKGQVFADTIGHVKKGEFPLLLQWDERWGYGNYGNNCIAVNGCAPTVISMVVAGLTGDNSITPYTVAQFADENGYYVPGSGSSWSLISEGIGQFGLSSSELPLSKASVLAALDSGMPVICSMRPGDFTTTGHFIVLVGTENGQIRVHDPNSKDALDSGMPVICSMRPGDFTTTGHFIVLVGTENGQIRVHDPNSKERSRQLWDYETLVICSMRPGDFTTTGHFIVLVGTENGQIRVHDPNSKERSRQLWDYETLEHQINNLWAVSPL